MSRAQSCPPGFGFPGCQSPQGDPAQPDDLTVIWLACSGAARIRFSEISALVEV
jgi:hypothetical protein